MTDAADYRRHSQEALARGNVDLAVARNVRAGIQTL